MMMKFYRILLIATGVVAMSLAACTKGDVGPQGPLGEQGIAGTAGDKGDKGDRGATGATGARGEKGDKGDRGATGATGARGEKGDKGDRGATGATGATGAAGPRGATGATGATGPRGATGAQGPKGDTGNANVLLYEFGPLTFTNELALDLTLSKETVDNSLILVYYNPEPEDPTAWYASPGLGASDSYQTRYFIYQISSSPSVYRLAIRTMQPNGSGAYGAPITFRKIKVIFAEASSILSAQANGQVDLKNYQSVKAALRM